MHLKLICVSLLLMLTALDAYGQNPPVSRRITGKEGATGTQVLINEVNTSQYPQVRIFATVLKNGIPLKGLGASDFRVREDEVDQEPLTVEPKLPPLSVVITLDTSGSMIKRIKETQAAAMSFLDTLGSNDSAQVVAFAREVKRLTIMSTNRQAAREAIGKTVARGDTALYQALYESIQQVKDRTGRKAIVLLSDGVDDDGTGRALSKHTGREVIGLAREVNVPIYVLGLGTEIDEAVLTEIANATGALYFNAPDASNLRALYEQIGTQLAEQYAIAYASNLPSDGTEHRVVLTSQAVTDTKTYKAPEKMATSREPAPKPSSKPVAPANSFEDHFNRENLGNDWEIKGHVSDKITISDGKVIIIGSSRQPATWDGEVPNMVMLRRIFSGDFIATVKVKVHIDEGTWVSFGYYKDERNHIAVGIRGVKDSLGKNGRGVYFARRVDAKEDGSGRGGIGIAERNQYDQNLISNFGSVSGRNLNGFSSGSEEWHLQLERRGVEYIGRVSIDGAKWVQIGTHTTFDKNWRLEFRVSSQSNRAAEFDDFVVKSIE